MRSPWEDHRDSIALVFAGYADAMEALWGVNEGLQSRVTTHINFEDYSQQDIVEISRALLVQMDRTAPSDALEQAAAHIYSERYTQGFANARTVRNAMEKALKSQARRLASLQRDGVERSVEDFKHLTFEDLGLVQRRPSQSSRS